jgi:hypothetical protein
VLHVLLAIDSGRGLVGRAVFDGVGDDVLEDGVQQVVRPDVRLRREVEFELDVGVGVAGLLDHPCEVPAGVDGVQRPLPRDGVDKHPDVLDEFDDSVRAVLRRLDEDPALLVDVLL